MNQAQYVRSFGLECPNCGSTNINGWLIEDYGTSSANRPCDCDDCGAEWTETYELTGYENLTVPNEEGEPQYV